MIKQLFIATIALVMASSCADPDKNLNCRKLFDKYGPQAIAYSDSIFNISR